MKKFHLFFCALLLSAITSLAQKKLTVAAAANVQFVMAELVKDFDSSTGTNTNIILNSSGKLTAQIKEGAPYDVFVSADMKYPEELYKTGFAINSPKVYANGLLVLWTTQSNITPGGDLKILTSDAIKKIAVANPQTAPYGEASVEAMNYFKVYDKVKGKLVYGESISQTNQYIVTRSADIGFTAKSIVLADEMKGKGIWIDVDRRSYKPIQQAAVILKHGNETNQQPAKKFFNYLYSDKAKNILKKYGYVVTNH
ncbi:MAG TPA: molybdate ABC transporter substrate-binding protein [Chitinophagaceae bacterium]|jgi:molybdate transport system substrate-binding protein